MLGAMFALLLAIALLLETRIEDFLGVLRAAILAAGLGIGRLLALT